jgi:hypothetical protein
LEAFSCRLYMLVNSWMHNVVNAYIMDRIGPALAEMKISQVPQSCGSNTSYKVLNVSSLYVFVTMAARTTDFPLG